MTSNVGSTFSQESNRDRRLERLQTSVLFDQLPQGLLATIVNGVALAYIEASVVGQLQAVSWLAVLATVTFLRGLLFWAWRKKGRHAADATNWRCAFVVGVLASGMVWGAASVALFPDQSLTHQAFLGFVLAGMTAGAVGSFAASHGVFLAFMLPTCFPYAFHLLAHGSAMQVAMGVMTIVFIATTWLTSKKTNATTTEALRLRFENVDLVEKLRSTNDSLVREMGERQRAQDSLVSLMEEANAATKAKSRFLANMSHEIRTPMNGVIGMADILSRSKLTERQRHQISLIQNSARSLLDIINDILDFSRIEAGKIELESAAFDLREVVGDAMDILADQAPSKGIELAYEVCPEVSRIVLGDQVRLRQVLVNLVGNAVKFTEKGSVVVRVTAPDKPTDGVQHVRFSVRDTGVGIDPAAQSQLFAPFQQADTSVTRRFGGTGLGLSISHHLVGLMGGKLQCTSSLGQGSEFFFSIPLKHASLGTLIDKPIDARLMQCRVLAADESAITLSILVNYLKSWKLDVETASTGAAVIESLRSAAFNGRPYAILVLSTSLGDMSGLEVAASIRTIPEIASTRLVLLTPINWTGAAESADERCVAAVLPKPVRQSQLLDALTSVVLRDSRSSMPSTDDASRARNCITSAHALLVEDNPINQEVAAEYLRGLGCTLDIAENGQEALKRLASRRYDIVFMDCQMPIMDGYSATKELRQIEKRLNLQATPVIALTASAFAGDREQCLAVGMNDYISKPFSPDDLRQVLRRWLVTKALPGVEQVAIKSETCEGVDTTGVGPDALDQQQIATLRARRPDLLKRLARMYGEHAPGLFAGLGAAVEAGDLVAIKLNAHSLKSSSGNVAALKLADLCQLMEVHAQTADLTLARSTFQDLQTEFRRVMGALAEEEGNMDVRQAG